MEVEESEGEYHVHRKHPSRQRVNPLVLGARIVSSLTSWRERIRNVCMYQCESSSAASLSTRSSITSL